MRIGVAFLAPFVALIALTLSPTERVSASVRPPVMETRAPAMLVTNAERPTASREAAHATIPCDSPAEGSPTAPDCPAGHKPAAGTCTVVAMVSEPSAAAILAPSPEGPSVAASSQIAPELVLGVGIFRPPRA